MSFIASSNQKLLQLSNPTKYRESPTLTKKSDTLRTAITTKPLVHAHDDCHKSHLIPIYSDFSETN